MHEIVKYFILTEIQKQCLNPMPEPLIGPGRPAEHIRMQLASYSGGKKTLYSTLRLPEFRFTYVQQGVQQNAQSDHALMHVPQSQSG